MRLLFVENHQVFAETVTGLFLGEHEVLIVPSLAAARQAIDGPRFDAVLVDYDLEDGKGDSLVRDLRHHGYAGRIVGISARDEGNEMLSRAGATAICHKAHFRKINDVLNQLG